MEPSISVKISELVGSRRGETLQERLQSCKRTALLAEQPERREQVLTEAFQKEIGMHDGNLRVVLAPYLHSDR